MIAADPHRTGAEANLAGSHLGRVADRPFAGVLFDMDGTLIDSAPSVERCWAVWSGEFGIDLDQLRRWHGVPALGVIAHFLPPERHRAAEQRLTDLELADAHDIPLLPGAAEALAALAGSGRVAIATSCTDALGRARVAASGLVIPPVFVTADAVARGKPAPDPYAEAARRLGVSPADCLVVEDAPAGLASGRAAGCTTLAVTTTSTRAALQASGDADAVVATLADVTFVVEPTGVRIRPVGHQG